jgi:hypothetical protein
MNQEPEWTPEEEDAFNQVEQQSNLGKQILRGMKPHEPNVYGDGNVYRGQRSKDSDVKTYHCSDAYEQGRQAGMTQERALWQMQAEGQKIEKASSLQWTENLHFDSPEPSKKLEIEQPRPVQVSALEFAKAVHGKESLVGQPTMWAEWPCKEQS